MKKYWNFQLSPTEKGIISIGFRIDKLGETIENEINEALPSYLKFHKVNKIVLKLGPSNDKDYIEIGGVGFKRIKTFSAEKYIDMSEIEKINYLRTIIKEVFLWLIKSFDDSDSFKAAQLKVSWL